MLIHMFDIRSWRSPKTEIREGSLIEGKGIFAKDVIRKGEIVAIKAGHILTLEEYKNLAEKPRHYCLQIEDNFFLGPKTVEEVPINAIFINHSCDPNVGFDGQITYVSLRDIKPGEELVMDYGMSFTTMIAFPKFSCKCGSQLCRKTVTGDDWKRKDLQNRYGDNFAGFILKKIKAGVF